MLNAKHNQWRESRFDSLVSEFANCPEIHVVLATAFGQRRTRDCSRQEIESEIYAFLEMKADAFKPSTGHIWTNTKVVGDRVSCRVTSVGYCKSVQSLRVTASEVSALFFQGVLVELDGPRDPGGIGERDRDLTLRVARIYRALGVDGLAAMYPDSNEIQGILRTYRNEIASIGTKKRELKRDGCAPRAVIRLTKRQKAQACLSALEELGFVD